jgi:hypothetical protein
MKDKQYCVYLLTNTHNTVLYTGVTDDLQRRGLEHKSGAGGAFIKNYNNLFNRVIFLPVSAGWKPCLSAWKPFGLRQQSDLSDFYGLRQGFIPPGRS